MSKTVSTQISPLAKAQSVYVCITIYIGNGNIHGRYAMQNDFRLGRLSQTARRLGELPV